MRFGTTFDGQTSVFIIIFVIDGLTEVSEWENSGSETNANGRRRIGTIGRVDEDDTVQIEIN